MYPLNADERIAHEVRVNALFARTLAQAGIVPEINVQAIDDVSLARGTSAGDMALVARWLNAHGYRCVYNAIEDDRMSVNIALTALYSDCYDRCLKVRRSW